MLLVCLPPGLMPKYLQQEEEQQQGGAAGRSSSRKGSAD
jgi:hypothetical protein